MPLSFVVPQFGPNNDSILLNCATDADEAFDAFLYRKEVFGTSAFPKYSATLSSRLA